MEMDGFALNAGRSDEMVYSETLEGVLASARLLRDELAVSPSTSDLPPSPVYRIQLKPFTLSVVVMMLNAPTHKSSGLSRK